MNVNINLTAEELHIGDLLRQAGYGKVDPEDAILTVDLFIEYMVKSYLAQQRGLICETRRRSLSELDIDGVIGDTIGTMDNL